MVRPSNQGNGWNHAAVTVEEESKHHEQRVVLHNPEQTDLASAGKSPGPRRRSMSVASTQPSVETVVSKAKRAASTLWTLLHAQVGMPHLGEGITVVSVVLCVFSLLKFFSRSAVP